MKTPGKISTLVTLTQLATVFVLTVSVVVFATLAADATEPAAAKLAPLTITSSKLNLAPGAETQSVSLTIEFDLAEGHHAYLDQFRLESLDPSGLEISIQHVLPIVEFQDKFSKRLRKGVVGHSQLLAVIHIPDRVAQAGQKIDFEFTYQACSKDFCLLPKHIKFTSEIPEVNSSGPGGSSTPGVNLIESAMQGQWFTLLWKVFLAGILASLTPCIYPMIPITLAVLGVRGSQRSRRASFVLSLTYVFGIALTYSGLGLLAAFSGTLFGSLLGHPVVAVLFATLFFALALSMFGLFEIQAPLRLQQFLIRQKTKHGYVGTLLAGMIAGVAASPCVGPVLAGILAYAAKTQNIWQGFILLMVFALGLGQLFILLGTFGHLAQVLPRSGRWMEGIKFTFGAIMVAVGLYYLRPIISDAQYAVASGLTLVALAIYFGLYRSEKHPAWSWARRLAGAAGVILGLYWALEGTPATWRSRLGLAIHNPREVASLPWQPYSDQALAQAKLSGRPVVIDFWAEWCAACKELEAETFSKSGVQAFKDKFVFLKYDATQSTAEFEKLQAQFEIVGLPHLVFFNSQGLWRKDLTLKGFEGEADFIARLKLVH